MTFVEVGQTVASNYLLSVVVVKRTWAKEAKHIEYYSDIVDRFVPTIDVGQESASRGLLSYYDQNLPQYLHKSF